MAENNNNHRGADDGVVADETTPLVAGPLKATGTTSILQPRRGSVASLPSGHDFVPKAQKPSTIVWILIAGIFFGSAAGGLVVIPEMRIFEDIICHQYYDMANRLTEPIKEELCKIDQIQSRLAYLFAINESITAAVGCLAALPWGIAADK